MSAGKTKISHSECLSYLKTLGDVQPEEAARQVAGKIAAEEEAAQGDTCGANQAALNINFRVYYHILDRYTLKDEHFAALPQRLTCEQPIAFLMLQSVLLTDHWKRLDADLLEEKCIAAILAALAQNSLSLIPVLKATNLLVKKFPQLQLLPLKLEHFYHCLQRQSQTGSREEALTLFNHCCKQPKRAFSYFRLIMQFWPWTNRNKYYLLSGILNWHSLPDLLAASNQSETEFFSGLRLSLSYKGLRAASQYPVKSLSNQRSPALLAGSVELLVNGSVAEIQNFHSQWFLRIQQRIELFELLQANPQIVEFLACSEDVRTPNDQLRLILIFSMFAKEIYATSKLHFFKISTELLTNCSQFETEAQLLIFRFLVENLPNFAVEDCLEFFYSFIERHRGVESSEFRNTMLGKMPTIINHTAKHFHKVLKVDNGVRVDGLAQNIKRFFSQLQELIDRDMHCEVYQPKIFALKLLEILNRSLYADHVAKNAKMCSTQQNQQMGAFLLDRGVFRPQVVAQQLFETLNNPQGFDDALDLTVSLIIQLGHVNTSQCVTRCLALCSSSDVDECALVSLYAQLAVKSQQEASCLYGECVKRLPEKLESYLKDPLLTAKAGGNLFGYLCVLDEVVKAGGLPKGSEIEDLLPLLERILDGILKFLNLSNARRQSLEADTAPSFQDMDESLQLLVSESAFDAKADAEACGKYLLMSFWLTLKGCCDLAASMGCSLLQTDASTHWDALRRCLDINVAVLTRCRHKGAIESGGLSIGRLTRGITSTLKSEDKGFQLLHECLERELLAESRQVSTTRRGAGFAIMFLHVLKNDNPRQRLLLHRAVQQILQRLNESRPTAAATDSNHDRWEALVLHYLCVLVRDTELRPAMSKYYNEIMMVAMEHIDNAEWTISNAALQLFGASLGKLVGQRQATEFETRPAWEPSELNYDELACLLPRACEHMLDCCDQREVVTSSIILFLGFLSKVEHLRTSAHTDVDPRLQRFRRLSWRLLQHRCEQVRQLAATCFVRAHEFRCDLPTALLASAKLAAQLNKENFYEGLLYTLTAGVHKLQHEARHVWSDERLEKFFAELVTLLEVGERVRRFKPFTLNVLLELLELLKSAEKAALVRQLLLEQTQTESSLSIQSG